MNWSNILIIIVLACIVFLAVKSIVAMTIDVVKQVKSHKKEKKGGDNKNE